LSEALTLTLGQSLTASPKTMSPSESAEQKSEEGAATQADDNPNAWQEIEAGLEQQDPDAKKDGHEEERDAKANEKEGEREGSAGEAQEEEEEKEAAPAEEGAPAQEAQEGSAGEAQEEEEKEDDDDEEAKAEENEPANQKEQAEKEEDREEDESENDEDAKESEKECVKEVAENADATAHQHEEPEVAEQPVTKRDRTSEANTSDDVEAPKKVSKCSSLLPDRERNTLADEGGRSDAATCQSIRLPRKRRQRRFTNAALLSRRRCTRGRRQRGCKRDH
jgi:hypothetical protein